MDFINRKGSLYHILCLMMVISQRLSGSNGMRMAKPKATFKIFRSKLDVFAKCKPDGSCEQSNCAKYDAECAETPESSNDHCEYCRCTEDRNTFIHTGNAKCKSDEDIQPKSAASKARFKLANNVETHSPCLKVESGSSNFVIGDDCGSRDIDMFWRWTTTGDKKLMNVKTLQCMEDPDQDKGNVIMTQCKKKDNLQKVVCNQLQNSGMLISWNNNKYLYLSTTSLGTKKYAISKTSTHENAHHWSSQKDPDCTTKSSYRGCYRFSDGSFMAYLKYDVTDNLTISAPIFKENNKCQLQLEFKSLGTRDDKWQTKKDADSLFVLRTINNTTKELQAKDVTTLKTFKGSLLKLKVDCINDINNKEEHCVLLKLESYPRYNEIMTSSPTASKTTSTKDVKTTTRSVPITINEEDSTQTSSSKSRSTATPTTQKSDKGVKDTSTKSSEPLSPAPSTTQKPEVGLRDASKSNETNSVVIAVPVTLLLLLALALALGYLVYYRRRKRAQVPEDNHEDITAVNNSKGLYEDPDRLYETLRDEGQEIPSNQTGGSSHVYNYADNTIVASPALPEQEYAYAKDTDMPRITKDTKPAPEESNGSPQYHTLEQEHHIANEASDDLEYTYAKDTDLSKATPNTKAKPEGSTSSSEYHTLEQEQPSNSEGLYNYIDDNEIAKPGSEDLEYTYAKDTDLPRVIPNMKTAPEGIPDTSAALYHTLEQEGPTPGEPEYSYAKNTDIPLIPVGIQQTPQGIPAPPTDSAVYHTLEEPSRHDSP